MRLHPIIALILAAAAPAQAAEVGDTTAIAMARPQELIISPTMPPTRRIALLKPLDAFYDF